jgi:hypothetical protein
MARRNRKKRKGKTLAAKRAAGMERPGGNSKYARKVAYLKANGIDWGW